MALNVEYKINLSTVFRRAFSDKPREVQRRLRSALNDADVKRAYGRAVINQIFDRTTKKNLDKKNKPLDANPAGASVNAKYSEKYKASDTFKIWKGGKRRVDLKLTGTMLTSMVAITSANNKVTITFTPDQGPKAHGHVNGTFSKKGKRQLSKRDFFGLPPEDEEKILKGILNKKAQLSLQNLVLEDIVASGLPVSFETTEQQATSELIPDTGLGEA
jgi:phage gpG-like protein